MYEMWTLPVHFWMYSKLCKEMAFTPVTSLSTPCSVQSETVQCYSTSQLLKLFIAKETFLTTNQCNRFLMREEKGPPKISVTSLVGMRRLVALNQVRTLLDLHGIRLNIAKNHKSPAGGRETCTYCFAVVLFELFLTGGWGLLSSPCGYSAHDPIGDIWSCTRSVFVRMFEAFRIDVRSKARQICKQAILGVVQSMLISVPAPKLKAQRTC